MRFWSDSDLSPLMTFVLWSGLGVHSRILFEETKSEGAFLPLPGVQSIGPDQSKTHSKVCRVSTSDLQTKCSAPVIVSHFMILLANENTDSLQKESTQPKSDIEFTSEWCSSGCLVWSELNLNMTNVLQSFLGCIGSHVNSSFQRKLFPEQHIFLYKMVAENTHRLGLKSPYCVKKSAQDIY